MDSKNDATIELYTHIQRATNRYRIVLLLFYFLWLVSNKYFSWIKRLPIFSLGISNLNRLYLAHATEISNHENFREITKLNKKFRVPPSYVENLIIGSGPGAACAQETLQLSNFIVLEKSFVSGTSDKNRHTIRHMMNDFESGGQEFCLSWPLTGFAQGSIVGGGSEVNSGLYHDLPESLVDEWTRIASQTPSEWRICEADVRDYLKLSVPPLSLYRNSSIKRGAELLGLKYERVRRWRTYIDEANYLHLGALALTWSKSLENVYQGYEVLRIRKKKSLYVIEAKCVFNQKKIHIKCKNIYLGAGALNTPRILLKSKLIKRRDIKFNLHPMIRILVNDPSKEMYDDIDVFQAWSKNGKYKFGGGVNTPSLLALFANKKIPAINQISSFYASFIPSGKGGFLPFWNIPYFKYSKNDRSEMLAARENLHQLLSAADCKLLPNQDKLNVSTVHVFGSLPLGSKIYYPGTSRLKKFPEIQIVDSSILPSAPGVNPQGPLLTLVRLLMKKAL